MLCKILLDIIKLKAIYQNDMQTNEKGKSLFNMKKKKLFPKSA